MQLNEWVDSFTALSGMDKTTAWKALGGSGILDALARLQSIEAGKNGTEPKTEKPKKERKPRKPQQRYATTKVLFEEHPDFYDELLELHAHRGLSPPMLDKILDDSEAIYRSEDRTRTMRGLKRWSGHFVKNALQSMGI